MELKVSLLFLLVNFHIFCSLILQNFQIHVFLGNPGCLKLQLYRQILDKNIGNLIVAQILY